MDLPENLETNVEESANVTPTPTATSHGEIFTHHMANDLMEATRLIGEHEVEKTMRFSTTKTSGKFGETGNFSQHYTF